MKRVVTVGFALLFYLGLARASLQINSGLLQAAGSVLAMSIWRRQWSAAEGSLTNHGWRELNDIWHDLTAIARCCLTGDQRSWKALVAELYYSASKLLSYVTYGPVLGGTRLWEALFAQPARCIRRCVSFNFIWRGYIDNALPSLLPGPLHWCGGTAWVCFVVLVAFLTFLLTTHIAGALVHRFFAHRCFQTSRR